MIAIITPTIILFEEYVKNNPGVNNPVRISCSDELKGYYFKEVKFGYEYWKVHQNCITRAKARVR